MKEMIKDFSGRIIGSVETDNKGNQRVRDFHGKVLGTYDARTNTTRDFYGRVVFRGNQVRMLLSHK